MASLSPPKINDLACGKVGQLEILRLIMGIMVNDSQASSTRPTRHLAWDTTGGPYPVAEATTLGGFSPFSVLAGVFHSFLTALKLAYSGRKLRYAHRKVSGVAPLVVHGVSK
jgi:hypothetical protein